MEILVVTVPSRSEGNPFALEGYPEYQDLKHRANGESDHQSIHAESGHD
jgi:hypothetical protein